MPVPGDIKNLKVGDDFHICPACGYEYGFHTSLLTIHASKDSPVKSTREVCGIILICPECGSRYDVGWRVSLAGSEPRVVRTTGHQLTTR